MPTPIRHQYLEIKQRYPEAIVLFRLGDFYEAFDEDAKIASKELEIVLTSREMGKGHRFPMAGIPCHALSSYLAKLVNHGYKVAICEQLGDPDAAIGLVPREVVRVVTPGTVIEPSLLEGKTNNYLASVVVDQQEAGVAYVDITTSEFATTQLPAHRLPAELERLRPSEVLFPHSAPSPSWTLPSPLTRLDDCHFELEWAYQALCQHFETSSLDGYGCAHLPLAIRAAGSIIHYLGETQKGALAQLTRLTTYSTDSHLLVDAQTQHNLELFQGSRSGTTSGSLLSVIDLTKTAMGGRLLRKWLGQPLLDIKELTYRQEAIEWLATNALARRKIISLLTQVADIERLQSRISGGLATPKELVALQHSLEVIPQIKALLSGAEILEQLRAKLEPGDEVCYLILEAIVAESASLGEGEVIKSGFSPQLDQLRLAAANAKQYLANLEQEERARTGVKSLKVGYNKVFGYYIEVSQANLSQVPPSYIRKQTLLGAERFFTPELKEYESLILNARDSIAELEASLFRQVCQQISFAREQLQTTSYALAQLDAFSALAEVAMRYSYIRPELTEDEAIFITAGRHPVVERSLSEGSFVPNNTYLANKDTQLIILTGPNMSGKSTYLRQVALIVLLAQIGSFVPAEQASIGLVDRIFTRIGAQEDIAAGQSTFMVEMIETANIINNATPRSLLILDEIGRGTSTYDGLSVAWAVAEYIHNHPKLGAKTLFATHYHELVELASLLPRVRNFNVAVSEERGKVIFLRKIIPGSTKKSYGIHVAQLAGLPKSVVHRAQEVLSQLEANQLGGQRRSRRKDSQVTAQQLPLFGPKPPVVDELIELDIDSLTPLEAITKLYELKQKTQETWQPQ